MKHAHHIHMVGAELAVHTGRIAMNAGRFALTIAQSVLRGRGSARKGICFTPKPKPTPQMMQNRVSRTLVDYSIASCKMFNHIEQFIVIIFFDNLEVVDFSGCPTYIQQCSSPVGLVSVTHCVVHFSVFALPFDPAMPSTIQWMKTSIQEIKVCIVI